MGQPGFHYHRPMPADDAAKFRNEYEECQAQAVLAASLSTKAQWLLFAQEWLVLAQAAEAEQRREAAISAVAPARSGFTETPHRPRSPLRQPTKQR